MVAFQIQWSSTRRLTHEIKLKVRTMMVTRVTFQFKWSIILNTIRVIVNLVSPASVSTLFDKLRPVKNIGWYVRQGNVCVKFRVGRRGVVGEHLILHE